MLLYAITDRSWTGKMTLYEQIHSALENGATCIQLREKELDYHSFLKEAEEIADMCNKYGVPFIINDNVDIAVACKATGVHVGQEDMNVRDVRNRVGDNMVIGRGKKRSGLSGFGRGILNLHKNRRGYNAV